MKKYCLKRKIKVCHIIVKMVYGGGSIGTLHLAQKIGSKNFENTIICGVQSEQEGNLLPKIDTGNISIIIIPELVRELRLVNDLTVLLKLIKIIKQHKYDIVHTHGSKAGVIGRIAAAVCRVPVILYTVHGWGLKAGNFIARTLYRCIERTVASFTTMLMFQTESDINEAVAFKIGTQEKYYLIGNGVNLRPLLFHNQNRAKKILIDLHINKVKVVGTIGRVSPQKNPYGFIKIAQKVLEKRTDVKFVFVGGGELLCKMNLVLKDLDLSDSVIFTGVRNDVPEILSNFDIFILPSLWEGLPRSVIEAMAMSKPVIVHDIGGIDEIVIDGKNGLIVTKNDAQKFADKIIYLLDNPSIAQNIGHCGLEKSKEYNYERVVQKVMKMYIRLCSYKV